ncbi:MAG: AAA family ATPase [Frankiaceae bacterium]
MDRLAAAGADPCRSPWAGAAGASGAAGAPEIVGRAAELARLARALDGTAEGAQVVQLSGDPWTGKTRLLTELVELARSRSWTVLSGSADVGLWSPPGGIPFGAFANALSDVTARNRTRILAHVPDEHQRWLARTFSALGWRAPGDPLPEELEDVNALAAVRSLLRSIASPAGLIVAIDDAHLADQASLDLLRHLVRHAPVDRFVVALAYRKRQAGLRTLSMLGDLSEARATLQVDMLPLADADALALLPPGLGERRNEALLRFARGNPGLLRALGPLAATGGRPEDCLEHLPTEALAASFRDFRGLSRLGWLAAQAAALMAEPCDANAIRAVAELTDTEIWTAIDELTAADVLRIDDETRAFRFRDPLLRAAARRSAGSGWLIGAHRRAATWLRSRGAPPLDLAAHLLGSDRVSDPAEIEVVLGAAESVLWERPTRTASWVRATLGSAACDRRLSARAHLLLARSLLLTGRPDDAADVLDRVEESKLDDVELVAELHLWRAMTARARGRLAGAESELRSALLSLPAAAAAPAARLRAELVALAMEQGAPPDPDDVAATRRAVAAPEAETGERVRLLALLALAEAHLPESAPATLTASWLADGLPDDRLGRHPHALLWLARAELRQGRADSARSHLERGVEMTRLRGLTGITTAYAAEITSITATATTAAPATPAVAVDDEPCAAAAWAELDCLSERELEIAVLVSRGRTNQQIAQALHLSHKTVETYLARIFKKLQVGSRAQVATLIGRRDEAVRSA